MNVYVQNHRLNPEERGTPHVLPWHCRFDHLDPWVPGGVDFDAVTSGLKQIGYTARSRCTSAGIQSAEAARLFARRCGVFRPEIDPSTCVATSCQLVDRR
jgi:hypothetical protein